MSESTYEHKPGNGSLFRNNDSNPDNYARNFCMGK